MFRLYCDEDSMDHALVQALEARGMDVTTALAEDMINRDDEHLDYATQQGRVPFSFKRGDFYQIHTQYLTTGKLHAGIIVNGTPLTNNIDSSTPVATPFLKWAGGKTQLLSQFADYYPTPLTEGRLRRYAEPFIGSGAVFFEVMQTYDVEEAYLSDINPELVLIYKVVQCAPDPLIERLRCHHERYYAASPEERKAYFYQIRIAHNEQRTQIDYTDFSEAWVIRAANLIFMNKTCFNGLYRVNSKAEFNVPFGRYKRPAILDEENLRAASAVLQRAQIHHASFEACQSFVNDRTFVYFDPPYRPLSATSSFTAYAKAKFGDDDQRRLAAFFAHLDRETGAALMLSNSDPANTDPNDRFFDDLYADFHIHRVYANRMINSDASKRGKISELLITNYAPSVQPESKFDQTT